MFFLAGAVFPLTGLPAWLAVLTKVDPLAYIVDPMRRAVFAHIKVSAAARQKFSPGLHWGSWRLPVPLELALVLGLTLGCLGVAVAMFSKQD
jgi:ABC-2 type transport system permease protein